MSATLDFLQFVILWIMDHALGWSLHLPQICILCILGVVEAFVVTYVQKFTTDQEMLRRMKYDKIRLKQFIREAKAKKDKAAIKRFRGTVAQIGAISMKQIIWPILGCVLPIALIATWAYARMGYKPPKIGQPIKVNATFATTDIGNLVYMLPAKDLDCANGWIQKIVEDKQDGKIVGGIATWDLRPANGQGHWNLTVRYQGQNFQKQLQIDGLKYAAQTDTYGDGETGLESIVLDMPEYKPLGVIPGIPWATIPPWLVGDLIIVIPLSLALRPILNVY